jgi:DNA-binding CsgD family transcriptional regulator
MHGASEAAAGRRDAQHLSDVLHRIYEASTDPKKWNDAVAAIATSFGSSKALLFTNRLAPQHGGLLFPVGISESAIQLWASSYIEHDIWALEAVRQGLWREGAALIDDSIVPREQFLASRFYREFLSTIGIARVCAGVVFEGAPGLPATALSVFRDTDDPAFDREDERWMKLIVGHLSRAMGIMYRLDTTRLQNASLLASFDRLEFGVALLDSELRVLHLNAAASKAVDRNDGLLVDAGRRLGTLAGTKSSPDVSRWLAKVARTPATEPGHFLETCVIPRKGGKQRYAIQCAAVPGSEDWAAHGDAVRYVAFITDPAAVRLPDVERLVSLYGLTQAQGRVAREFARGSTYKEAARRLGISEETVRAHVKEIYPKMRVNRQADLVRLVLSLGQSSI